MIYERSALGTSDRFASLTKGTTSSWRTTLGVAVTLIAPIEWARPDSAPSLSYRCRMTKRTAAEIIAEGLELHGVRYVFGIPGAKIDAVFNALEDRIPEVVVCRHEQNAAFMAAAVGRLTRRPGVCIATSGPGSTNLVTGLATATTEGDPVVALVGAVPRADQPRNGRTSRCIRPRCSRRSPS